MKKRFKKISLLKHISGGALKNSKDVMINKWSESKSAWEIDDKVIHLIKIVRYNLIGKYYDMNSRCIIIKNELIFQKYV